MHRKENQPTTPARADDKPASGAAAALPANWETTFYKFGQKSAALLALLLRSNGTIKVFARKRVRPEDTAMVDLYSSEDLMLERPADVNFRFALRDTNQDGKTPKVGLLTIEALDWPRPYEVDRVHMLGYQDPFGVEEIVYSRLPGGNKRPPNMPANRQFFGTFKFSPNAGPRDRAELVLTDVQSGGMSSDLIHVSALDETNAQGQVTYAGGVIIAVRVPEGSYDDGCARLDFFGGPTFAVETTAGDVHSGLHSFVLNTTSEPTAKSSL